ncbi:transposase [Micromonospora cathayae]|uniref:transposase n=1 Tax=Micromonospora cathayae TaxID=3028804 RepID=UPI003C6DB2E6
MAVGRKSSVAAPKKYPDDLRQRAVRLYRESDSKPVIRRLAEQLGVHHEALRNWIRQAEAEAGERTDRPTSEMAEENRRLRRAGRRRRGRRSAWRLRISAMPALVVQGHAWYRVYQLGLCRTAGHLHSGADDHAGRGVGWRAEFGWSRSGPAVSRATWDTHTLSCRWDSIAIDSRHEHPC